MTKVFQAFASFALACGILGCEGGIELKTVGSISGVKQADVKYQPGAKVIVETTKDQIEASYPLVLLDPDKVCSELTFYNQDGDLVQGTRSCDSSVAQMALCSEDGQTGCVANASYAAAHVSGAAAKILAGQTLAGVSGNVTLPASSTFVNCTAANQSGCVATTTYKTMDLSLAGATTDLTSANFNSSVTTAGNFEFWDSTGARWVGSGTSLDPWNVRAGSVVNGVTGQLKTSCRNRANASLWDIGLPYTVSVVDDSANTLTIIGHPFTSNMTVRVGALTAPTGITIDSTTYYVIVVDANTIKLSITSGPGAEVDITAAGASVTVFQWNDGTLDWWDSIDDYNDNSYYPLEWIAGTTSNTDCNYSNWQDLTADGACDAAADNCIMKDRISGLTWSESYPVAGAAAASTSLSWQKAIQHCNDLSFGGFSGWRLATQKELMEAWIHGIRDVGYIGSGTIRGAGSTQNNDQFILDIDYPFWSGSTDADNAVKGWYVDLYNGMVSESFPKSQNWRVICVR